MSADATASAGSASWVQPYIEAWNSHDPRAVTAFMVDDVVHEDVALGERAEGTTAMRTFVDNTALHFSSDYRFDVGQVITDGESYAIEWTMSGTNDRADPYRGLAATGRSFRIPGVSIGRLRNGAIARNRDYWNLAAYLVQVGLMPGPETPAPAAT